jgi:hypothetical protein
MRGIHHGIRLGRLAASIVTLGAIVCSAGPVAAVPPPPLGSLPDCPPGSPGRITAGDRTPRVELQGRVDASGALRATILRLGDTAEARLGASAFADGPFGGVVVVGERSTHDTKLVILDLWRRCVQHRVVVPALVFGSHLDQRTGALHLSLVEPVTRRELGIWRLDPAAPGRLHLEVSPPSGALATARPRSGEVGWDGGPVGRWCAAGRCEVRRVSGGVTVAVSEPDASNVEAKPLAVSPRPVPEEPAPRWPRDTILTWRWHSVETPPTWIRDALTASTTDVAQSRRSRTPTFRYDAAAADTLRYTTSFPSSACSTAIACASYVVGGSWTVRLRPHGSDFRWGTLRWCQADGRDGCFDAERVTLHELGHIVGIDHPESAGFGLRPFDTVMHQLSPSRPAAGSGLHVFGPCDVATLQMRYDVLAPTTPISTCNSVDTVLGLTASAVSVPRGTTVSLVAALRIADREGYGRLSGNGLSGRSVQLRRRPVGGTSNSWTTFWMRSGDAAGTYVSTVQPSTSYEFQAVYLAPASEGLHDSVSPIVTVRVLDGCTTTTCGSAEDPMQ